MSNDPAANMASLCALCDDLCETESATVDRRQLCEWLSAMQAQALDYLALDGQASEALARATAAEAERDALRELVKDLADDLVGEIEANYPIAARLYPSEQRRYDRDMAVVLRARAALGGQP